MKLYLLLAVGIVLNGCNPNDSTGPETFNSIIQVEDGGQFELNDTELIVVQSDLLDSRCPVDVTCIWAGFYQVSLSISQLRETTEVELCNWHCASAFVEMDTAYFELNQKSYGVILKDMLPIPTSDNHEVPREAVLEFFRL